jgi:hypothetical protein
LDCCESWESYESLGDDWFGKSSNTLEPSLWIHIPSSGVKLLLRFGIVVSTVGWNVLGLQPVVSYFINISALYYGIIYMYMNVFLLCIFNYRLTESLDYACLLDFAVHVIKVFSFMHPQIFKGICK